MMIFPNKGHFQITDKSSCTNLSIIGCSTVLTELWLKEVSCVAILAIHGTELLPYRQVWQLHRKTSPGTSFIDFILCATWLFLPWMIACVCMTMPTHIAREQKTLQMHGFPMGNSPGGISLIQMCESTILTVKYVILTHSACPYKTQLLQNTPRISNNLNLPFFFKQATH